MMVDLNKWIKYSLQVLSDQIDICSEHLEKGNIDLIVEQGKVVRRNLDCFLDFVQKRRQSEKT
jgi:hypothetical protein